VSGSRRRGEERGYYRAGITTAASTGLTLPEGAKVDEAKAVIRDGVLEVVIPTTKVEDKKRRLVIEEPTPANKTIKAA
jgi:HSP20 family molecular chaperone IbpA